MGLRETNIEKLGEGVFDALVVGAGVNGAVSAAALAGKGARVALIDKSDFASFTSQESSNLAWGGFKYLQTLEFGLVWSLCKSRNHLIRSYPSTVQEIRFFTSLEKGFKFPPAFVYAGAWLYWFMGRGFTRTPRYLTRGRIEGDEPTVRASVMAGGFEYSDAYLHDNDARFVFGFVRRALDYGCIAANYVSSRGADRGGGLWVTRARDETTGREFEIRSKTLVNAAGPFVDEHNRATGQKTTHRHVFSKGIHLIVDRVTPNKRVLTFFASDGRPFFAVPMGRRTCIGTTDTRVESPYSQVTDEDRDFVLENINARLRLAKPLTREDVIAERCGVRPLVVAGADAGDKDWTQLSRKHVVEVNKEDKHVSIFGGKLTDCLNVGDEIAAEIAGLGVALPFPRHRWYGEPSRALHREYLHQARLLGLDDMTDPDSSEKLSSRLWRRYGAVAFGLLERIREDPAQAEVLIKGTEYIRCEIDQTARREMVVKLEDFLRRRSKIAMVERKETIRRSPGLMEACRVMFGEEAEAKFKEYFGASA